MIRIFLIILIVFQSSAAVSSAEDLVDKAKNEKVRRLKLIELYKMSNDLPREFIDLQNDIEELSSIPDLQEQLPIFEEELKELAWEVNIAESTPDISYHQLALIDSKLEKAKLRIDVLNREVGTNVDKLQRWYSDWLKKDALFVNLQKSDRIIQGSSDVKETEKGIDQIIEEAQAILTDLLEPNLLAGKSVGELQTQVYGLNEIIVDLIRDTNALSIQQTSPSMFSKEFYTRVDARLFAQAWESFRLFALYQWEYITKNLNLVISSILIILLLAGLVHFSTKLVQPSSGWYEFASRPFTTAVFLVCTTFSLGNSFSAKVILPPDWEILGQLPLIFAVAGFSDLITKVPWQNTFLRRLTLFLAGVVLLTVINVPQPVLYIFVFYSAAVVFLISFYNFIKRWRDPKIKTLTWAIWLWGLFPTVIIFASLSGYDQLAALIFGRVLVLVVSSLIIWLMLKMSTSLLEVLLLHFPLRIIRNNSATIVKQLFPLLLFLHGLLWLAIDMMVLWVSPTLMAAFEEISSLTFSVAGFEVTPGSVILVILVCYATVLVSRAMTAFLKQEVLPRYGAEEGVQVSITRLVHYAVLTIGLLILLRMLGFGLNQIAILGGALSVGIGFGLQAIVNNFVSGLILLFERPIKVGDMIEVGEEVGEVKELGLRATTVQTYDNAEIVIPNSELITGSVTNWTLADKKVRVRVPVGVAYGTDVENVLRILLECADNNPQVLSTPTPKALFLAFGASSLDFELRVWILDAADRIDVLSDLNQDIDSEFQMAGIEIPFPQTDLHVRSVDEGVVRAMQEKPVSAR